MDLPVQAGWFQLAIPAVKRLIVRLIVRAVTSLLFSFRWF